MVVYNRDTDQEATLRSCRCGCGVWYVSGYMVEATTIVARRGITLDEVVAIMERETKWRREPPQPPLTIEQLQELEVEGW